MTLFCESKCVSEEASARGDVSVVRRRRGRQSRAAEWSWGPLCRLTVCRASLTIRSRYTLWASSSVTLNHGESASQQQEGVLTDKDGKARVEREREGWKKSGILNMIKQFTVRRGSSAYTPPWNTLLYLWPLHFQWLKLPSLPMNSERLCWILSFIVLHGVRDGV